MELKDLASLFEHARSATSENGYLMFMLIIGFIILLLHTIVRVAESALNFVELLKSALSHGMELVRGGARHREHIERRKQFLSVLGSDLAGIGKAEAWNDQNFTDLEAEVQVEGGYYATVFDRIRRRRSFAQRKEPSLIGAIDGSTERCLLLTGDPGAGKSVALRHLAVQMIERTKKSKRKYAPIPLYINLRELGGEGAVDSSAIRKFVIDNVRRGDADTAEYVQSNWSDFNKKGGWFFLFDSFDEIPEVLHAANEDTQIDRYGRAIQQFMDGLGSCRGVLASREYKSPKLLAWPKLKILPLNESLQEELVNRTFLDKDQKGIAVRALSSSPSSTYRNPLFLTLLCRFVRDNNAPPKNEHELLYRHVEALSSRDSEFVRKKWGLSPTQVRASAAEVARIFAMAPDIGLAPTVEELANHASRLGLFPDGIEHVVESLTYVKIGRMDVASASRSERRFAFSHRRYHEAIFAKYLSENPDAVEARELLCNPRWREYLVAMLQSTPAHSQQWLIDESARILGACCASVRLFEEKVSGFTVRTYAWDDRTLMHLLQLMVDVKRFNPSGAWGIAEDKVEAFFGPLWAKGDAFDRLMIIKLGGAGSSAGHSRRLDFVRQSGVSLLQEEAVSSCQFATNPSAELAGWIRGRVSSKIITSPRKFELLKWEAIASQLPPAYDISACLVRAKAVIRQRFYAEFWSMPVLITVRLISSLNPVATFERALERSTRIWLLTTNIMPMMFGIAALAQPVSRGLPSAVKLSILGIICILIINFATLFIRLEHLSLPRRIKITDLVPAIRGDWWTILLAGAAGLIVMILMTLPGLGLLWLVRLTGVLEEMDSQEVVAIGSAMFLISLIAGLTIFLRFRDSKVRGAAVSLLAERRSLRSAISSSRSSVEILHLCRAAINDPGVTNSDVRRTISFLSERLFSRGRGSKTRQASFDVHMKGAVSILLSHHASHAESPT